MYFQKGLVSPDSSPVVKMVCKKVVSALLNYILHLFPVLCNCSNLPSGLESGDTKPFWKYVRSQKQEHFGITALRSNGSLYTDSLSKSKILNKQTVCIHSSILSRREMKLLSYRANHFHL